MASMSQSWNSILKFANTKFRSCLRPIAFHKSLQSLALLNLVLIQLKAEEGPQAFLDADEYHQAQAKCTQRSLGQIGRKEVIGKMGNATLAKCQSYKLLMLVLQLLSHVQFL